MKEKLKNVNYSYLLVLGLVVKAIVSPFSAGTFLIALPVLGYEAYKLYLKNKEPDPIQINHEIQREVDQIKAKLSSLTMEKNVKTQPSRYF